MGSRICVSSGQSITVFQLIQYIFIVYFNSTAYKMSLIGKREEDDVQTHKAASPEPSSVSMKSGRSLLIPSDLNDGTVTADPE